MKWYFASRTRHQADLRKLCDELKTAGEEVTAEWLYIEKFESYEREIEKLQDFNIRIVDQIKDADIFVLISDEKGTDMFVELGVALGNYEESNKRIYIVGDHAKRSLMQLHPSIVHATDLSAVFDTEGIVIDTSQISQLK